MSDTSDLPVHPLFRLSADGDTICLKSSPLEDEGDSSPTLFYATKTLLSQYSHVFNDMFTLGEATSGEATSGDPEVVQLAEDSDTIAFLLSSMSEDLQKLPDLLDVSESGIIILYTAAFKYGMAHVQALAAQNIR
jgi:hypothetical protein